MQITLRGIPPELEEIIRREAHSEGVSLNKATLRILRKGAGLSAPSPPKTVIGSDLDHLFGVWKAEQAEAFLESIRSCEQIDAEFWK